MIHHMAWCECARLGVGSHRNMVDVEGDDSGAVCECEGHVWGLRAVWSVRRLWLGHALGLQALLSAAPAPPTHTPTPATGNPNHPARPAHTCVCHSCLPTAACHTCSCHWLLPSAARAPATLPRMYVGLDVLWHLQRLGLGHAGGTAGGGSVRGRLTHWLAAGVSRWVLFVVALPWWGS